MTFLPGGMNSSMQKTCEGTRPAELTCCDGEGGGLGGGVDGLHRLPLGPGRRGALHGRPVRPDGAVAQVGPVLDGSRLRPRPRAHRGLHGPARRWLRDRARSPHAPGREAPVQRRRRCRSLVPLARSSRATRRETPTARATRSCRTRRAISRRSSRSSRASSTGSVRTPRSRSASRCSPRARARSIRSRRRRPRGAHGFSNGPAAPPSGLTTPAYELASGTQVFIGPFVGMMFGP